MRPYTLVFFISIFVNSLLSAMQSPTKTYDPKVTEKLQDKVRWLVEQGGNTHENKVKEGAATIVTFVKQGADPNAECNDYRVLPISWAASCGLVDIVNELLKLGANPNLQNSITLFDVIDSGSFPHETRKKMIELLLVHGADPNKKRKVTKVYSTDPTEESPLSLAFKRQREFCYILFEYDADPGMLSDLQRKFLKQKLK